jgi:hypothetical protein
MSLVIWIRLIVASKFIVSKTSYLQMFIEYIFEDNWDVVIKNSNISFWEYQQQTTCRQRQEEL